MNSQDRLPALLGAVDERLPDIRKLLPPSIKVDRFMHAVRAALMQVPNLQACTKRSIVLAMLRCASDGLVPDGRDAVLVVGTARRPDGSKYFEAQYWQMVQGLQKMAYRSGRIIRLESRVVAERDTFAIEYGTTPGITHRPAMTDPGKLVGAYAVATLKGGFTYVEWMTRDEIDGIMRRSKSFDRTKGEPKGPWKSDFSEMARKTVMRRACKYLPFEASDDDQEIEVATPEAELQVGSEHPSLTHLDGGQITSGVAREVITGALDELDSQEVAEAELLDEQPLEQSLPEKPSAAAPEHPTSREDGWPGALARLNRELDAAASTEAVEETWEAWDASFEDVPREVTADAKAMVDARVAAIKYAQAKG
jgi:recombination protein RecT